MLSCQQPCLRLDTCVHAYRYSSESDSAPEDVLALKKVSGVRREEASLRPYAFVISGKVSSLPETHRRHSLLRGCAAVYKLVFLLPVVCVRRVDACHGIIQGTVFPFAANSEEEMESWLRAIGKGIVNATTTGCCHPFSLPLPLPLPTLSLSPPRLPPALFPVLRAVCSPNCKSICCAHACGPITSLVCVT